MEKYIMAFEDGKHYIADKFTDDDLDCVSDGILTIIRCSDGKEITETGEAVDLPIWEN